ncbi:hypothetical protein CHINAEXTREME_00825 [Halobiforma lacisalsi AJ5]|uniref:DUF7979 domain-containing protein n=1 Tax=Natronobacterium lacisalsi AJ5 TaxID=358396 RepID=M0LHC4_NATLA|nr:hypothetical protein [Halobiforma lacisalsi]APW96392.1 hypothetical protein CHINAEXTREME_00825 [Halobiforma lacisalsi AJ5]EMA31839.1 hypothetical protein C445_13530 [Halobiforma lacisalsi AJ5]
MYMASSELSTSDLLDQQLTVRRVDSVDPTATVRHVDQLEPAALEEFYELCEDGGSIPVTDAELEVGEVIVFTDYFVVDGV